jgi:glycosyltransferase involved in cell wall biosynthesis
MRVAVVANTAWYLFNFRTNLMRALRADGHTVVAVAPADDYTDRIQADGFDFVAVPISGSGTNPVVELGTVLRLHSVLKRHRIDVVLSYTPKGNLYSAMASIAARRRFVPNVSGLGRLFIRRSALTVLAEWLYRLTFGQAQRVFFQNNDDMAVFVDKGLVMGNKAERLPGSGVDLMRFVPGTPPTRQEDRPVFLLVARMLWDKGVGEYVHAAQVVRALHPQARFQLLGPADVANPSAVPLAQIEQWVRDGFVEYLGSTDDVRDFIEYADAVVLPSYREGVPRTLLEAAAMCRPVLAADAPGCRDTVIDGESGFLFQPADGPDLADKLLRFISLPQADRHAMGRAGRALMERRFDERLVIDRYRTLLNGLSVPAADQPGISK